MGTIIYMSEHRTNVTPKSTAETFNNQRYILQFNPNEEVSKRWSYTVKYTRQYTYEGYASTEQGARTAARAQISRLATRERQSI